MTEIRWTLPDKTKTKRKKGRPERLHSAPSLFCAIFAGELERPNFDVSP